MSQATRKSIELAKKKAKKQYGRGINVLFQEKSPEMKRKMINEILQENLPQKASRRVNSSFMALEKGKYLTQVAKNNIKLVTAETLADVSAVSGAFIDPKLIKRMKIDPQKPLIRLDKKDRAQLFTKLSDKIKSSEKKVALAMSLNLIPKETYLPKKEKY